MSKLSIPRGTKDILPDEMMYWHHIENTSRSLFSLYNYKEIRTPIFEPTSLFQRGIGADTDIVEKEMYTFDDKKGRSLTLRPEGTASIVRSYIMNNLNKETNPAKLYYCGPMFRYERPQAGRYRQFHQIGIENIGVDHAYADAEIISLGVHLFDELGLAGLSVSINSVGCTLCRPVIEGRLKQFIEASLPHLCQDCNRRFKENPLRILDCKNKKCKTYFSGIPDIRKSLCQSCTDHFNCVLEYLDDLGVPFKIEPKLVRGLDYYTRTVFEIISDQLGAQNAICGGGRYDNLIEQLGGKPTPAVGFAFGLERAVMVLQQLSDIFSNDEPLVFFAPLGFSQQTAAFHLVNKYRKEGVRCEIDYTKTDLKAQFKKANKLGADYAVIYGEDEAEKKSVVIKNMKKRSQEDIKIKNISEYFKNEGLL